GVSLHWRMGGVDHQGRLLRDLARGRVPILFPHRKVAPAHTLDLQLPETPALCTVFISARSEGETIAENFVHFFAAGAYPQTREEAPRALVLRAIPGQWTSAEWNLGGCEPDQARADDACYGSGHGFFEWTLPLNGAVIGSARRLKLLCEASSHRSDN